MSSETTQVLKMGQLAGFELMFPGFWIFEIKSYILLIAEHVRCTFVYINQSQSKKALATSYRQKILRRLQQFYTLFRMLELRESGLQPF